MKSNHSVSDNKNVICINGGLNAFVPSAQNPWDMQKVRHLFNRCNGGASYEEMRAAVNSSPSAIVNQIVNNAVDIKLEVPEYANLLKPRESRDSEYAYKDYMMWDWIEGMMTSGFRYKMTLFWHSHFATQAIVYTSKIRRVWNYYRTLSEGALGDFRTLCKNIGQTDAMLIFLNGNVNLSSDPNENYARELFELFTLGEGNGYTEQDIVEAARALTGYKISDEDHPISYIELNDFDHTPKTIFGQTGNFDFEQTHDLIFTERAGFCAKHICRKLYQQFIYHHPNENFVAEMANYFKQDWNIAKLMKKVLSSEHFYHADAMGTQIKDPITSYLGLIRYSNIRSYNYNLPIEQETESDIKVEDNFYDLIWNFINFTGQRILNPPNVAGWQGHRKWINQNLYVVRKQNLTLLVNQLTKTGLLKIRDMLVEMTNTTNNPKLITQACVEHFIQVPLENYRINQALTYFKANVPKNYFDDHLWTMNWQNVDQQIKNLLLFIVEQPEFELY